jgi:hypothetical protein
VIPPYNKISLAESLGGADFLPQKPTHRNQKEIVEDRLPRFTAVPLKNFDRYILLTNFDATPSCSSTGTRVRCRQF